MLGVFERPALCAIALLSVSMAGALPAYANGDGPIPYSGSIVHRGHDVRVVTLGLNKSIVVDLPRDARDVLVSNPKVADAIIRTPRRIYLTGVAVGQTNIMVFDRAGQEIVSIELAVERSALQIQPILARLIPDSSIKVEVINNNIVLSGTVQNAGDAQKAVDLATAFAEQDVAGGAEIDQSTSEPSSDVVAGETTITGSDRTQIGSQDRAGVINLLTIEGEDQVHLKVTIAEIERNAVKQLGIDWDIENLNIGDMVFSGVIRNLFPINGTPSSSATGSYVNNIVVPDYGSDAGDALNARESFGATINALERSGVLRTLAEPTLTAISGEQASFLAGGEFPYQTVEDGSAKIEFKKFGVSLAFSPVVLSEGRISLKVETEVSELAPGLGDIPSLRVRRAQTTLELPSGGSMVLGGLLQDNVRQSLGGLPGLKKLPILGTLFRSRDYQRRETELVIFITPYLVKSTARDEIARPDDGFSVPNDLQATFMGRLNNIYGGAGSAPSGTYHGRYGYIYE